MTYIRSFPSSLVPLFQSESKCKTILMKMTLICMVESFRTWTRFETEAQENSEMAYWHTSKKTILVFLVVDWN